MMPERTFYTRVHKWYREFLARFVVWKKKTTAPVQI
jgi:hypothetical protein